MKLATYAQLEGFITNRPTLNFLKYAEGIICLSGCMNGEIHKRYTIINSKSRKAGFKNINQYLRKIFYLEIQRIPGMELEEMNKHLITFGYA